ncbi:hypothetical protein Cob_v009412 [Colletotrichum orbiculare MAFF 240422]|uniref:Rhodopsin domain-containing protein n=1 Tax=Colletotrichum orbiculare (strain 104-T / ATCC 96160 / CBS 514.97 / LARS 414 / MAFF 240422) TaxID=1213857 RepID=A0A484FHH8_COLOR|nr:hypothetical protein Cob_v009412 [Colletotrichum orbiculare MAFF 240422]
MIVAGPWWGYVRGYLLKGWGLDDWFFMLSGLFSTAQCLMILLNASDSTLGQHVWNIPYLVAIVLVYQASFAVIKATYLLQYRRAFAVRFMRVFCNTLLAVVFVTMCTFMISGAIVMRPLLDSLPISSSSSYHFRYFGVGMFTGGISIMRIVTLGIGIHSEDPFYESVPLILLGMAEITSANICISAVQRHGQSCREWRTVTFAAVAIANESDKAGGGS